MSQPRIDYSMYGVKVVVYQWEGKEDFMCESLFRHQCKLERGEERSNETFPSLILWQTKLLQSDPVD